MKHLISIIKNINILILMINHITIIICGIVINKCNSSRNDNKLKRSANTVFVENQL
jgi:hypothetical protein